MKQFEERYAKWVEDSRAEYEAGNMSRIVGNYPYLEFHDTPWTPFEGDPGEHKFALITSGGLYLKGKQEPFDTQSIHGDPSFREIPRSLIQEDLGIAHSHYDHSLAADDFNCIFPLYALLELEKCS